MFGIAEKENETTCNAIDNDIERQLKQCKAASAFYNSSKNHIKSSGQRMSALIRGLSGSTNSETIKDDNINRRQFTVKCNGPKFDQSEMDQHLLGNQDLTSICQISMNQKSSKLKSKSHKKNKKKKNKKSVDNQQIRNRNESVNKGPSLYNQTYVIEGPR